jgi:hypothetical protein
VPASVAKVVSLATAVDAVCDYRCDCINFLGVFGSGRHRVYFEPGNTALDDPVMNGACPSCGRELPGKSRS